MKTHELKKAIEAKVEEIKTLKKKLRQDHRQYTYSEVSGMMESLHERRREIRAMYLIYGWFRGKRISQIEKNPVPWYLISYYTVTKILDDDKEKVKLFKEWMVSTT